MKGRVIGDARPAFFGGHIRPANLAENRKDRGLARHQTGKLKVVVVIRERGGETLSAVLQEGAS